jgi:hypothetical protein
LGFFGELLDIEVKKAWLAAPLDFLALDLNFRFLTSCWAEHCAVFIYCVALDSVSGERLTAKV